jgi:hypothetical protein
MGDPKKWTTFPLLALEINEDTESVLLLKGAEMGMFDLSDVKYYFRCKRQGDVLIPVGLNYFEQAMYLSLAMNRNGGYSEMTMRLVMMSSLHRGEFCDSVLWQKGQDPDVVAQAKALVEIAKERTKKEKV